MLMSELRSTGRTRASVPTWALLTQALLTRASLLTRALAVNYKNHGQRPLSRMRILLFMHAAGLAFSLRCPGPIQAPHPERRVLPDCYQVGDQRRPGAVLQRGA